MGKFDIVFSNPPYQVMDGGHGSSAKPIYNKIVEYIIDNIEPKHISIITPSRWMAGGKGLNSFRARMLSDKRIKIIKDFPGVNDIFKSVDVMGGVSYFLWEKEYSGDCAFNGVKRPLGEFDIIVRDNIGVSILKKVITKHPDGKFCDNNILPCKPFGISSNFKSWEPEGVNCYSSSGLNKVNTKHVKDSFNVKMLWKSAISEANGAAQNTDKNGKKRVVSRVFMFEPNSVCTETYLITGSFNSQAETVNYLYYMCTKFYRFMLSLRVVSQHINKNKFAFVPDLQNYNKPWSDEELYQHFGLTQEEIEHIEATIKELN